MAALEVFQLDEGQEPPANRSAIVKPLRAHQMHGNFSPDGRFVAYTSNESGRFQVYVQTFR